MASNEPAPKAPFATSSVPGAPGGVPSYDHGAPFGGPYGGGPYGAHLPSEASHHAYAPHVPQPGAAPHSAGPVAGQAGHGTGAGPATGSYRGMYGQGLAFTQAQSRSQGMGQAPGQGMGVGQGYGSYEHQNTYAGQAGPTGDTDSFPAVGDTGSFPAAGHTGSFPGAGDTGSFAAVGDTDSFPAVGDTGSFPAAGHTGSFAAVGDTGAFPAVGDTGFFPAADDTGTGYHPADTGSFPAVEEHAPLFEEAPLDGPLNSPDAALEFGEEGSATSISPLRGKHRVIKQRSALARGSTVLGVGVIAAVGAGGIAAAEGKPPVPISMPDAIPDAIADHIPQRVASLPVVDSLVPDRREQPAPEAVLASAPLTTAGVTAADLRHGESDAGEALRARILQQASAQQQAADDAKRAEAEQAAARAAKAEAAKAQAAAQKKADEAKKKAAAEARRKAEEKRLAELAKSYTLPVVSYTITGQFGDPGPLWSSGYHTGLDFAAPTGTPIKAVHGGTVTSAGLAGAYGYRTVVKLDDGEELWYCHQSSMLVSVGQKISTGDVIGRVGATGNVTGPHLHLEVHTTAGTAIDPAPWLANHGLKP